MAPRGPDGAHGDPLITELPWGWTWSGPKIARWKTTDRASSPCGSISLPHLSQGSQPSPERGQGMTWHGQQATDRLQGSLVTRRRCWEQTQANLGCRPQWSLGRKWPTEPPWSCFWAQTVRVALALSCVELMTVKQRGYPCTTKPPLPPPPRLGRAPGSSQDLRCEELTSATNIDNLWSHEHHLRRRSH